MNFPESGISRDELLETLRAFKKKDEIGSMAEPGHLYMMPGGNHLCHGRSLQ
jgi:hypothetical protein